MEGIILSMAGGCGNVSENISELQRKRLAPNCVQSGQYPWQNDCQRSHVKI